jgi:hypothetical protein
MKILTLIAQVLVGLVFVVFGSDAFLHFIPAQVPPGLAGEFLKALIESKYVLFVGGVEVAGGALLLVNRFVPLGLTLLGPVVFNILVFHLLLSRPGGSVALVVSILWAFLMLRYRKNFASLFEAKPAQV